MTAQLVSLVEPINRTHHDLRGAIEAAIADADERYGLHVTFSYSGEDIQPVRLVHVLDELVREALLNVSMHAGTTAASVEVTAADEVWLRVRDHGHGTEAFQLDAQTMDTHLARVLRTARELGARIGVHSAPGQGTSLRLRIPIPNEA